MWKCARDDRTHLATEHAFRAVPILPYSPRFFCYLVEAIDLNKFSARSAQPGLNSELVRANACAIPPLDEQDVIADFLDRETARIDALIDKKRRLLELLEEKRLAVITHAVTRGLDPNAPMKDSGIDWLGQIPADWEVKRLKQLVREGSSISYGVVQPGPHQDDGVPFIQTTDLVRGHLSLDDLQRTTEEIAAQYPRSRLAAGDVLLGIRASVGDTCVVTSELDGVNLSRGIARVVPGPSVIADFLSLCLKSDYVYSYWMLAQQGSTFREVSIASVKELPLAVPPMVEQAAILASVFKKTNHVERATQLTASIIDLLQEYRSALITNAVTGKIDVRGKVEKEAAA